MGAHNTTPCSWLRTNIGTINQHLVSLAATESQEHQYCFEEFHLVIAKLWHTMTMIPAGKGLLSPFNKIICLTLSTVYLHCNNPLMQALQELQTFLTETMDTSTKFSYLVMQWLDLIGIQDMSSFGVGGIVIGESHAFPSMLFCLQRPADITKIVISEANPWGAITNSNLEYMGMILLWLVMEGVCLELVSPYQMVHTLLCLATMHLQCTGSSG